ncbi:hypothetical protein [uncultured Duncaniella sp.]|jgi:hypothetical protein|uniref:hypothetical protein n=1 Tax=uncultured Duncaniella sp. TaxID=2768039 RepID=UPI0025B1D0C6|nr:hypothetical protein [uncultured Duncaniella sp.]
MKPIWYKIGMACVLISAIGRMADKPLAVLIVIGVLAVIFLTVRLYDNGKISIPDRVKNILKKIGVGIVYAVGIIYLGGMAVFVTYKVATEGDMQGIMLLCIVSIAFGISWYISRWRRWWVKFIKTFMPKDQVNNGDWKFRENYYWTFDYDTNAQYGLRIKECIFEGRARVWLDPKDVDASLKYITSCFYDWLKQKGIETNLVVDHMSGCIYAYVVVETKVKTMTPSKLQQFRDSFRLLSGMNYEGDYYGKYHGELGTIFFESTPSGVIRAIRTEPREERYLDPDSGFGSDEAYYFISSYPVWNENECELITQKEFFNLWHEYADYEDGDEAFSFFTNSSTMYFAAVANGDKKERANSRWDIENAAKYLIAHDEVDIMKELLTIREDFMFWAAKLFHDVIPELCEDAANRLVENYDDPVIVRNAKRMLTQWKKGGIQ